MSIAVGDAVIVARQMFGHTCDPWALGLKGIAIDVRTFAEVDFQDGRKLVCHIEELDHEPGDSAL